MLCIETGIKPAGTADAVRASDTVGNIWRREPIILMNTPASIYEPRYFSYQHLVVSLDFSNLWRRRRLMRRMRVGAIMFVLFGDEKSTLRIGILDAPFVLCC